MCQATIIRDEISRLGTSLPTAIDALIDNDVPYIKHGHYHYQFALLDGSKLNIDLLTGLILPCPPYILPEIDNSHNRESVYPINANDFTAEYGLLN